MTSAMGSTASMWMDTSPRGAYFSALDKSCSTTKPSHFSSVSTVTLSGSYFSATCRRMNCLRYLRTHWRTTPSSSQRRSSRSPDRLSERR